MWVFFKYKKGMKMVSTSRFLALLFLIVIVLVLPILAQETEQNMCEQNYIVDDQVSDALYNQVSQVLIGNRGQPQGLITNIQLADDVATNTQTYIEIQSRLSDTIAHAVALSPDNRQIMRVFTPLDNEPFLIVSDLNANHVDIRVTGNDNWLSTPYWLSNHEIVVSEIETRGNREFTYRIFNISENINSTMTVEIPIELSVPSDIPILSPDKEHITFPVISDSGFFAVIMNINTSEYILVQQPNSVRFMLWSPSSDYIAFATDSDASNSPRSLNIINTNGEQIADFSLTLSGTPQLSNTNYFEWSPDSQKLVYFDGLVEIEGSTMTHSKVFDLNTNQVTSICLSGERHWSPDSRYLFFLVRTTNVSNSPSNISGVYVFDLETMTQVNIASVETDLIGRIIGWANLTQLGD